jgi:hypothetical protein
MKFHLPSYLLGIGTAMVVTNTRDTLRPVFVELIAVGVQLRRVGRGLIERQNEHVEDLRAEIEERVRQRMRPGRARATNGVSPAVDARV